VSFALEQKQREDREQPDAARTRSRRRPARHAAGLNLEGGAALSLHSDGWNVYASYTIVDRGELDKPETTLPILDGGFDQHQVVIGVQYRFEPKPPLDDTPW
jgi:hypothetical protein